MPVRVPPLPCRAVLLRSMTCWIPGAAPSISGKVSTIETGPRCHAVGAAAPGTARIVAATFWASAPFSTRTLSGFMTPGLIWASASIWRPAVAVLLPGKSFSCALLGLSWESKPTSTATELGDQHLCRHGCQPAAGPRRAVWTSDAIASPLASCVGDPYFRIDPGAAGFRSFHCVRRATSASPAGQRGPGRPGPRDWGVSPPGCGAT